MDSTSELDEKLKKLTQQLAQSESERNVLRYERDLFREKLEQTQQQLTESDRLTRAKHREAEVARNKLSDLQREREAMSQALKDREAVIQKAGLVLYGAESKRNAGENPVDSGISLLLLSAEVVSQLERTDGVSLDDKLRQWLNELTALRAEVKQVKMQLDLMPAQSRVPDDANANQSAVIADPNASLQFSPGYDALEELQRETSRQLSDIKLRLLKAQEEKNSMEQQSQRFEQQAKRLKQQTTELETENESLKQDRRRIQKDLREKEAQVAELEYSLQERSRQIEKLQKRTSANS